MTGRGTPPTLAERRSEVFASGETADGRRATPAQTEVPDAVSPPLGNPRFPLFDSLRAVAAVSIVFVHGSIFSGADRADTWYRPFLVHLDIGVTLFFLLSGFLLYRPMLTARLGMAPATPIGTYARRRFLRIVPAYWLALTVLTIYPGVNGVFTGNWWVFYGFMQNFPIYTPTSDCSIGDCGILPAWSLAVEVTFYLSLPLFALAMAWVSGRVRRIHWLRIELMVLAALALVSVAIQDYQGNNSELWTWFFFSPLGRAWWFGLGMALAAISVHSQQHTSDSAALRWVGDHPVLPWALAALIYFAAVEFLLDPVPTSVLLYFDRTQFIGAYILYGVIAALVLLPAIVGGNRSDSVPRRVLAHPVLAWLGLISYGIFLWHWPIMAGLTDASVTKWWPHMGLLALVAMTLAITLVCASVSYYLLERPLMRHK